MRPVGVVFVACLALGGCSSSIVTPDGTAAEYRWIKGQLGATLSGPMPRVQDAVRAAFEELNLVGMDGAVDGLRGELSARLAVGTKVRVKLKALDFETTAIRIRVGRVGDRSISLQLLRHIQRRLE